MDDRMGQGKSNLRGDIFILSRKPEW